MNNSVFGKTMENIRKHRNIRLVNNKKEYLKTVMKPKFKSGTLLGNDLMACEMGKVKVVMNKPVYLGQAILDLSKLIMYEFHYDYMMPKYGKNLKLCYMDTDSFVYDIKTEDFYKDIAADVETRFDTSGYIGDRPLPTGKNKKVIGLCLSRFQLGTSPPGNPRKNFFERANPGHPGKIFCLIPCPGAKNDGRILGGGAKFSQTRRNCSLSLQKNP